MSNGAWGVIAVPDDIGGWMAHGSVHRNPTHSAEETIEKTRPCSKIEVAHLVSMTGELGLIMRDDQRG
jgi:fructose 1,6-bisphosphatase